MKQTTYTIAMIGAGYLIGIASSYFRVNAVKNPNKKEIKQAYSDIILTALAAISIGIILSLFV